MSNHLCPQCQRELTGTHKFCPYCGYDFRAQVDAPLEPLRPQAPAPDYGQKKQPPLPKPTRTPAPPARAPRRGLRLLDLRVLVGWLGLLELPLILVLAFLLWTRSGGSVFPARVDTACSSVDPAGFALPKFQSGLTGELEEDTRFGADTEYLIQGTLLVPKSGALLIEPGATLQFTEDGVLEVQGALYACGESGRPITFTGEDQAPGAWNGVYFNNAADDSVIEHALLQFGGNRVLILANSEPALIDVEVANSDGFGISSDGRGLPSVWSEVVVDDNPFNGLEIRGGAEIGEREEITWPDFGLPYVFSGPVTVDENATLTIETGIVVKFWQGPNSSAPGLTVRGLLQADEVFFTSVFDSRDAAGGSTYIEARDPAPGDWAGITFDNASSRSSLHSSQIAYAGQGSRAAVLLTNSAPDLSGMAIADTAWYPISADATSEPTLADLTLTDNDPGDAVEVRGNSSFTGRQTYAWDVLPGDPQLVRVIRGVVTVEQEATLRIAPGAVVKFEADSRLEVRGTLRAIGGSGDGERIVFTSLRDDDYGGRTDKNTGPQDDRGWDGIVLHDVDQTTSIESVLLRYGTIYVDGGSPQIQSVTIRDSATAAIWLTPSAAPTMADVSLSGNETDGAAVAEGRIEGNVVWEPLGGSSGQIVRVLAGDVRVTTNGTLRVAPGTIVKANGSGRLIVDGSLQLDGGADSPVILTSVYDDAIGGDTTPDLRDPVAGDWPGVVVGADGRLRAGAATIRFADLGLNLQGSRVPVLNGILLLENGVRALRCTAAITLPADLRLLGNEVNERDCPQP